jgi:hypothetical protein
MEYSGRTTCLEHKRNDWKKSRTRGKSCIQEKILFDVQWSDCPVEVEAEIKELWRDNEFGNDNYYFEWKSEEWGEDYPIINEFLKLKGITECLIHWWW